MVFEKLIERRIIKGEIIALTPLHIGSGKKDVDIGDVDMPIITDTFNQPYIPGSSIKGKARAEAERIARQNNEFVCNPPNIRNMCGTLKANNPQDFCICCKMFGTAGSSGGTSISSKLRFRDSYPIDKIDTLLTRAGTALDRNTGSVSQGPLYSIEAVPVGSRFGLEIICENMTDKETELLKAAIRSIEDSSLGGLSSRGFGKVSFKINSISVRTPKFYLGEERERNIEGKDLESWQKTSL
jgi:CRISPR-associated RAMP protein (TIGR02581 family)